MYCVDMLVWVSILCGICGAAGLCAYQYIKILTCVCVCICE